MEDTLKSNLQVIKYTFLGHCRAKEKYPAYCWSSFIYWSYIYFQNYMYFFLLFAIKTYSIIIIL